ncbi:fanconi anemia group M protein [Halovenus aranensis]|uniref:Fanconi anemia group M protein n=1 Tax=Halovenus aranensis TaxID=890420 RepID=A0A1G8VNS5_9EURY|nr:DEAD/DEAH box helicase [Halovenus aranensis]SDJ67728.1 fanconi anemia group M protein [Halovenus aranensis]
MATTEADTVDRPLVSAGFLEDREYQTTLADRALDAHTLVCLPTGLGKTTVSLLVTAHRLSHAGGKSLLLAPTKPLVTQHADFYREALEIPDEEIVVFTGEVRPDDRASLWDDARIVIATPQVVENDLVGNRVSLADVTHCTFDECHRATGDYAYNYIAERYHEDADDPLVTGMSASPGDDEEAILQVCGNLGIGNVEVMTEDDADVARYTHETDVEWKRIELPETVEEIRDAVEAVVEDRMQGLVELGVTNSTDPSVSEREIQKIQGRVQQLMNSDDSAGYEGMSLLAEVRKLRTALTYVETQSVESFRRYMDRQREAARSSGASKADQRMVSDPNVKKAVRLAEEHDDLHPKFRRARMLIAETLGINDGERVIVFTESRDTAEALTDFLGEHFSVARFVGQSDTEGSDGMTQTQQQDTLDQFRAGEFEVLVSTSVAEEGLDVPEVDLVLFYEPVPTAIRSIQRKGRTGRQTEGRVAVLLAEDTRDEAYFWKARQDEKKMEDELRLLKDAAGDIESRLRPQVGLEDVPDETEGVDGEREASGDSGDGADTDNAANGDGSGQAGLDAFAGDSPEEPEGDDGGRESADAGVVAEADPADGSTEIVIDQRELDSAIARDLSTREGIETRLETLEVGDYVLSDRVVVERKAVGDFLETLVGGDRSMFEQVGDASRHYGRPVVVIEGEELYGRRNIHPKAIHGALASLAVDFGASVMQTTDEEETADLLEVIATREQEEEDRAVSVHGEKQSKTLPEQQEYVVASIAEVGPVTARSLLQEFGSVEAVMTAETEDLLETEGVGEVTAERIREVVSGSYTGE